MIDQPQGQSPLDHTDGVQMSGGALQYIFDRSLGQLQSLTNYIDLTKRVGPRPNELGPKDVVFVNPQAVTRVVMKWQGFPGPYVYHCHILDHEDNDMMRPIAVLL
jgi:spore coat protein A